MHPTAEKKHLGTHTDTQMPRVNVPVLAVINVTISSESYKSSLKVPIYKTLEVIHSHAATGDHRKSRTFRLYEYQ